MEESYLLEFYKTDIKTGLRCYIGGQGVTWTQLNKDYIEGKNIRGLLDKLMDSYYLIYREYMLTVEITPYPLDRQEAFKLPIFQTHEHSIEV